MINVEISTFDKNQKKIVLKFMRMENSLQIDLGQAFYADTKMDKIDKLIREYNSNYGIGQKYYERDFFKLFGDKIQTFEEINILRSFAIMNGFTHWFSKWNNLGIYISGLQETYEKYLTDQSLIDWTGEINEPQPILYFIKHSLLDTNKDDIDILYKCGMLYQLKIKLSTIDPLIAYFIPLELPNSYLTNTTQFWKRIVNDGQNELAKKFRKWE